MQVPIEWPTYELLLRIAPTVVIVLSIFLAGYALAWWSRGETVKMLKEWLEDMRRK